MIDPSCLLALLTLGMADSTLDWLKATSALVGIVVGIISLFAAAGSISVLFYRMSQSEKSMNANEVECEARFKKLEDKLSKEISRTHERLDQHEEDYKPVRDAVKSMQTDLRWIKQHIQNLMKIKIPQDDTKPPLGD